MMIDWLQDPETTRVWFDPVAFSTYLGGYGGAGLGVLFGTLGAAMGVLAPRGKGRRFFRASLLVLGLLGLVMLAAGVYALASGQPYGVWYPLALLGGLSAGLGLGLRRGVERVYQHTEQRRLQAESLRRD